MVEVAAMDTVGAVVSTLCDVLAAIPAKVNDALFDAASRMVPTPAVSVLAVALTPSVSLSPEATVYENTKAVVPVPLTYEAVLFVAPTRNVTVGVPVTFTASVKLNVA